MYECIIITVKRLERWDWEGWGRDGRGKGSEREERGEEGRGGEGLLIFYFIFQKPGRSRVIQASM